MICPRCETAMPEEPVDSRVVGHGESSYTWRCSSCGLEYHARDLDRDPSGSWWVHERWEAPQ